MAPAALAVGLGALSSRAFAGPSNLPLWLSHIGYLLITDMLRSSQVPRSRRHLHGCTSIYRPATLMAKAALPACKFKTSYIALDRVAQPTFHALCMTAEFKQPEGHKYLCKCHML